MKVPRAPRQNRLVHRRPQVHRIRRCRHYRRDRIDRRGTRCRNHRSFARRWWVRRIAPHSRGGLTVGRYRLRCIQHHPLDNWFHRCLAAVAGFIFVCLSAIATRRWCASGYRIHRRYLRSFRSPAYTPSTTTLPSVTRSQISLVVVSSRSVATPFTQTELVRVRSPV